MQPTVQLIDDILNPCSSATAHKAAINAESSLPQKQHTVIITTLHAKGQDRHGNPPRGVTFRKKPSILMREKMRCSANAFIRH